MADSEVRLNPFALPTDTTIRFVLLILSVISASLLIYNMIWNASDARFEAFKQAESRAKFEAEARFPGPGSEAAFARQRYVSSALAVEDRKRAAFMIAGALLVAGAGWAGYLLTPLVRIRRGRLEPIRRDDAGDVLDYVSGACETAGIAKPPELFWNPIDPSRGALAFGTTGSPRLAVGGGLVTLFYTDQPLFRSIIFHELAHIKCRDIGKTYYAVAVWQAFLLVAALPWAVIMLDNPVSQIAALGARVAALALLVFVTRNGVLRAREHYADVMASVWDGPDGALTRALGQQSQHRSSVWSRMKSVHPSPDSRRAVIRDTVRLFRVERLDYFVAGAAAALAISNLWYLVGLLTHVSQALARSLVPALVIGSLIATILAVSAWRQVFAKLTLGRSAGELAGGAVWMALGFLSGEWLSFTSYALSQSPNRLTGAYAILFQALWLGLIAAGIAATRRWLIAAADAWSEKAASAPTPLKSFAASVLVAGVVTALWLGALYYVKVLNAAAGGSLGEIEGYFREILGESTPQSGTLVVMLAALAVSMAATNPVVIAAAVALWAFPLFAAFGRSANLANIPVRWLALDPGSDVPSIAPRPKLRPLMCVGVGLVAAFLASGLSLAVFVLVPSSYREQIIPAWTLYGQCAVAVFFQGTAALIAAMMAPRLGSLHGLAAAFVGGVVASMAAVALAAINGLMPGDWQLARLVTLQTIGWGFLAALVGGWVGERFGRLFRRSPPAPLLPPR